MNLTKEESDVLAAKAREDLITFCILTEKSWEPAWFHEKIGEALMRIERGELRRLIIEMPPRHGKSKIASVMFPAWYLGRNPGKSILSASYNDTLATEFGGQARDLMKSVEYRAIFRNVSLKEGSEAKGLWKTDKGGNYMAGGVGASFTGFGGDLLLLDDPFKNREEADSETVRNAKWAWWTSSFYTRQHPGAAIVIINTRWHFDDVTGRLEELERKGGEKWERIRFPAIAEEDDEKRKVGEALWSARYPLEELDKIKSAIGVYDWSSLYQQTPIAAENQEFKREYFRTFEEKELEGKRFEYYTAIDLAIGQNEGADNTVVTTVAKEVDGPRVFVVEQTIGRLDPFQGIEALFTHYMRYRPIKVGIEAVAYQASFAYYVQEEQRRRGIYFYIEEIKNARKKEERIRGLIPMYRAGVLYHRPNMRQLEQELLLFPKGKHDDCPDSLEMCIQIMQPTVDGTIQTYKQPAWEGISVYE